MVTQQLVVGFIVYTAIRTVFAYKFDLFFKFALDQVQPTVLNSFRKNSISSFWIDAYAN